LVGPTNEKIVLQPQTVHADASWARLGAKAITFS